MRQIPVLEALFSPARRAILTATFTHAERWWYLSDLARHLGTRHSTLQRELVRLTGAGLLHTRREGNRVYFRAADDSPVFLDMRSMIEKTSGLAAVLRATLESARPEIIAAFVYGSAATGQERSTSDIDVMILSPHPLSRFVRPLREAEERLGRPVNALVYAPEDLAERIRTKNSFVRDVLAREKIFIVGSAHELEALDIGRPAARSTAGTGRTRQPARRRTTRAR